MMRDSTGVSASPADGAGRAGNAYRAAFRAQATHEGGYPRQVFSGHGAMITQTF